MAKTPSKRQTKVAYQGFINVNLTKEQEVEFDAWALAADIGWDWVADLVDAGYKLSFDYDSYNQGFKASLYANAKKLSWAGYTMTAWAGDVQTAMKLICYKHFMLANQDWDQFRDAPKRGTSSYG
jgi:hypothetical protein